MSNGDIEKAGEGAVPKVNIPELDIPAIADSLKQVYLAGSIPLSLIFVAAVAIFILLVQGTLAALPVLSYLINFLIVSGIVVFLVMNWLGYKQWKDELNVRLENRRLEMDLYVKISSSERKSQDDFLIGVLRYAGELSSKSDSTPEGRKKEIDALSSSLGTLVKEFASIRNELKLPEFTAAFPALDIGVEPQALQEKDG